MGEVELNMPIGFNVEILWGFYFCKFLLMYLNPPLSLLSDTCNSFCIHELDHNLMGPVKLLHLIDLATTFFCML